MILLQNNSDLEERREEGREQEDRLQTVINRFHKQEQQQQEQKQKQRDQHRQAPHSHRETSSIIIVPELIKQRITSFQQENSCNQLTLHKIRSQSQEEERSIKMKKSRGNERVMRSRASLKKYSSQVGLIVLLSLIITTCLQANGFLLNEASDTSQSSPASPASASNQQVQSSPSSTSSSSSSPSSPGILATLVDTAAKAAISSLSGSNSASGGSSSSAGAASSGDSHAPTAKSLGAASSSNNLQQSSGPSSIVASLSSAVASAAVASAVAAAKNSLAPSHSPASMLSSSARSNGYSKLHSSSSLSSQSRSNHLQSHPASSKSPASHQSAKANPLNHIAMRLADAIPEVPYSILHNMKKLDHAAPFYNVDSTPLSKASGSQASLAALATGSAAGGIRKESSVLSSAVSSLLSSAISAASGAASSESSSLEQLGAIFRTPLWRRLADGAGDFAAEFRSFFKPGSGASGALATSGSINSPSKASGSALANLGSMSHLMRELSVSVPFLMLLATKAMKTDWRPTRSNRKSFMQNILGSSSSPATPSVDSAASSVSPLISSAASPAGQLVNSGPSSFLSSLVADPMQMSGSSGIDSIAGQSPSGPSSFGGQIFNAMQQQQQVQQQQSQRYFPSFMQSNPLASIAAAAAQDAMSQRSNVAPTLKRMGDLQNLAPVHDTNNLNLNELNLNSRSNEKEVSSEEAFALNGISLANKEQLAQLEHQPAKPVINSNTIQLSHLSSIAPLTFLNSNANDNQFYKRHQELIDDASDAIDQQQQNQARSMQADANWISGSGGNSQLARSNIDHGSQEGPAKSRAGKLWKNLSISKVIGMLPNNLLLDSLVPHPIDAKHQQAAAATRRRNDDTKLINLNDKHRYSLVVDENDNSNSNGNNNAEQLPFIKPAQRQSSFLAAVSNIMQGKIMSNSAGSAASGADVAAPSSSESGSDRAASAAAAVAPPKQSQASQTLPQPLAQTSSQQPASNPEQRDLSQLVPQSWKDAVKRTYSNVQHSASTQWRSIEGQISSWLKPGSAPPATPSYHQAGSAPANQNSNHMHGPTSGPVGGFFSNVGSAAVNMLGLGNKQTSPSTQTSSSTGGSSSSSSSSSQTQQSNGNDSSSNKQPSSQKGGLAGMASMIFNTITGTRPAGSSGQNNSGSPSAGEKASTTFNKPGSTSPAAASSASSSTTPVVVV